MTEAATNATSTEATVVIDQPGVYDLPVEAYHRDPVAGGSLSSTGARMLLPPSCPAKFKHWLDEGERHSRAFDLGHGAHRMVLGVGPELVVIDATNYNTKAAQTARDAAHAEGRVPLLLPELDTVVAMAEAIRAHPIAGPLFAPGSGQPEQTIVWFDHEFGIWRRALLDWLRPRPAGGRLIVADYKSGKSADPEAISKAIDQYGYDQQLDWHCDGARALGLAGDVEPAALLIVQEKTPPYLITPVQLDDVALERGRLRNRLALDEYRRCRATDTWPGYADTVIPIGLPSWAERQHELALERGDYDLEKRS